MYAIVDIETTGNTFRGNRITEIAIFVHDGKQVVNEYTTLVNPECEIPFHITALTGIDNEMVASAPTFDQIASKVYEITKDAIFVAHSVNFDFNVIKYEFELLGISFQRKKLCTVRLSRKLFAGLPSYSLGKLCGSLGIPLHDRHRARGDAAATVILFEWLQQQKDAQKVFDSFIKDNSRQATLPPLLDKKVVNNLPERPGVYHFMDKNGETIYVGKAKNIKKRVLQHLYDKTNKEMQMCREVADITFETSGSELVALLMESAAIKKQYPKYNSAQKRRGKAFGIFTYQDRKGIIHLGYNPLQHVREPLEVFYSIRACILFLKELCADHQLCSRYCQLQRVPCTENGPLNACSGVCRGIENVADYNVRVTQAVQATKLGQEDRIIKEKGRTENEDAFVMIQQGKYLGYGFINKEDTIDSEEDLELYLIPQKDSVDTQRIIRAYLRKAEHIGNTIARTIEPQ